MYKYKINVQIVQSIVRMIHLNNLANLFHFIPFGKRNEFVK